MTVFAILAVVWAWALVPPWLADRRRSQQDPVAAFARFQGRDLPSGPGRLPARAGDGPRRRQQVFAALLALDAAAFSIFVTVGERWALALTAAGVHVTVAWYGAAVRLRLRARVPMHAPAVLAEPRRTALVLLPAA